MLRHERTTGRGRAGSRRVASEGGAVSTRSGARSRAPALLRAVSVAEHPLTGYTFEFRELPLAAAAGRKGPHIWTTALGDAWKRTPRVSEFRGQPVLEQVAIWSCLAVARLNKATARCSAPGQRVLNTHVENGSEKARFVAASCCESADE